MFGIGVAEFLAVLVLALIVLGPERLPRAMRTLGRWVRQLRQMTREFRKEFAEEFSILYEEMDVLRQEAENTRKELADIRTELSDTLQGAADDVNVAGKGVMEDLRGAVSAPDGAAESTSSTGGSSSATPANDSATPSLPAPAATAPPALSAPSDPLPAADAMALAIQDTFAPAINGQVVPDAAPPPVTTADETSQPAPAADQAAAQPPGQRLSAFAPDVNGPTESDPPAPTAEPSAAASAPAPAETAASTATTPDEPVAPAALGPPTPGLQNQMGGFMRLMVMQALEADPGFADRAEAALRSQARADAESLGDLEDPEPLDIAQAWAARRRHLVPHDAVEVDQRAESSAVIEFGTCPYGLTPGKDHPVCSVSNVYDDEFFKRFDMKATYTTRMSDGADRCQLIILTHARMRKFGLKIEDDTRDRDEAAAEHEAVV